MKPVRSGNRFSKSNQTKPVRSGTCLAHETQALRIQISPVDGYGKERANLLVSSLRRKHD
jgi:hypothetical protein